MLEKEVKNLEIIIHNQESRSKICLQRNVKGPKFFPLQPHSFFTHVLEVWIFGVVKISAKDSFPLCPGSA
jgi:hypothetical protein